MSYFELFLPSALYTYEYHPKSRIDPYGNTGCQKIDKMDHFWHLSKTYLNVNVARFARNV